MTADNPAPDPDHGTAAGSDSIDERVPDELMELPVRPLSAGAIPGRPSEIVAVGLGTLLTLWAVRALARQQLRAIPYGIVGMTLLVRAATGRVGEPDDRTIASVRDDHLEATVDAAEAQSIDDDVSRDPRTTEHDVGTRGATDPSVDEAEEPPSAAETSEVAGPKPAQAEPTQTAPTEPEATSTDDASADTTSGEDHASEDGESETGEDGSATGSPPDRDDP